MWRLQHIRGKSLCFVLLLALCCACESLTEVASNLNAKQSVEMVVALGRSGIEATREASGSGQTVRYSVLVRPSDSVKSFEILHEYGLPREIDDSLEALTRPRGFAPNTPQLAQLRLDHALELRIERALLSLPGVVEARIVVQSDSLPSTLSATSVTRGVSAVVRFRSDAERQAVPLSEIRELIAKAVPGGQIADVELKTTTAQIPSGVLSASSAVRLYPFSFRVPSAERSTARIQILVMFAAFCLAGILMGFGWNNQLQARRRRRLRTALSNNSGRSMFLEASLQENAQTKASLPQVREEG